MTQIIKIQDAFAQFMESLGLDLSDSSLQDTPRRVAKMFVEETCYGLFTKPPTITTFNNDNNYHDIVLVKDISVKSLCEHHFQPFIGSCHIAYIPDSKIVGLSKLPRVVDYFARRPQVQERLTQQIFEHLKSVLQTENIAIFMETEHYCMKIR